MAHHSQADASAKEKKMPKKTLHLAASMSILLKKEKRKKEKEEGSMANP